MSAKDPKTIAYRRCRFSTTLPVEYRFSRSHCWIAEQVNGLWHVGLTRFGARLLGEMVDHGFEVEPGTPIVPGQIIGWVEGFKAITDLTCPAEGVFVGGNPVLRDRLTLINRDPHQAGWLYALRGRPDRKCLRVHGYAAFLDKTIDRLRKAQKATDSRGG